ncbi:RNA polymerase sigma factor [Roseomonas xinghualingensis]|uniref:RNA polymerase sigma factor n=1 Tax=Roseomonas xinghualingensis TaxID=2986475 RepID=UPI0021F0CE13|nr:sigma-70 family RNA polymerase sigma factor [Roseomonas sp. SXEYE001]MCV4207907.1 sigma-70 family RNA polymerase sigma factor [Roseomonas sp. SXEYE001]
MAETETHRTIEAIFRIERARLIASLARMVRDIGLAEELAQDALVTALAEWPEAGIPQKPGAWLITTAKRRAIDMFRRNRMLARKHAEIARDPDNLSHSGTEDIEAALDDDLGDELLGLIFTACHPLLPREQRIALTLRLIGGLTTEEIARAFLSNEPAIAQRIVRAKKTLGKAGLNFEVPRAKERDQRLASVLEVVYLIFNEGYAATAGKDLTRPALCAEAQRLGRILAGLMAEEPEVLGLLALMEIQASRLAARTAPDGSPILITEQNRARWDHLMIRRGLAALQRAEELGGARGAYALQAALAACHARARRPEDTDWRKIAGLYDTLRVVMPSPVVELNRAVAHSMAFGPEAGLALLDALPDAGALRHYAPLPAARGDFLFRSGRLAEARIQFELAATLTRNEREKDLLLARASTCGG